MIDYYAPVTGEPEVAKLLLVCRQLAHNRVQWILCQAKRSLKHSYCFTALALPAQFHFEEHLEQTKGHVQRLEQIFRMLGENAKYPERNWSVSGKVQTPNGLVEDNIPEDQSLVLNTTLGLVILTGCGHAGVINILTYAGTKFPTLPVYAIVGGLHLFSVSDEQLDWTGDKFKQFRVANLLGAHCTGIEAVYRVRQRAGLTRKSAVVGTVGSTFTLDKAKSAGEWKVW